MSMEVSGGDETVREQSRKEEGLRLGATDIPRSVAR